MKERNLYLQGIDAMKIHDFQFRQMDTEDAEICIAAMTSQSKLQTT